MKIARRKRIARQGQRGFTLTELMVSLVMGLIVALAAVGLARNATTTFHEQARSSTTEMSLRMGSDRLRQDLMRASYMSTGNIVLDPKVAKLASAADPVSIARFPELQNLRGVRIDVNMANVAGGIPAALAVNSIRPDAIELVGNFTTDDAYSGTVQNGATTVSSDNACTNAQTITLDTAGDAATYALGGGVAGSVTPAVLTANAKAAFMPVTKKRFLAQITDAMGCTHYAPVCDVAVTGAAPNPKLLVMIDAAGTTRGVLYSNTTSTDQGLLNRNCGASEGGRVTIAPLSRIRYRLATVTAGAVKGNVEIEDTNAKTDLIREVLDFTGTEVQFTETVAEYIVDLKFGIVLNDPMGVGAARQKVVDIDTDTGTGDIQKATYSSDGLSIANAGPQDVRAVRFRLSARAAVPDRKTDLTINAGAVRARFCVDTSVGDCQKGWARVRTVTSEVALLNQTGMNWR